MQLGPPAPTRTDIAPGPSAETTQARLDSEMGTRLKRKEALDSVADFQAVEPVRRPSNFVSFAEFAGANDEAFRQQAVDQLVKQRDAITRSRSALEASAKEEGTAGTPFATRGSYSDFQKAQSGAAETVAGTQNAMAVSSNPMEEALRQVYRQRIAAGATDAGKELEAIGAEGVEMAKGKDQLAGYREQARTRDEARAENGRLAKAEAEAAAKAAAEAAGKTASADQSELLASSDFTNAQQSFQDAYGRPMTAEEVSEWLAAHSGAQP